MLSIGCPSRSCVSAATRLSTPVTAGEHVPETLPGYAGTQAAGAIRLPTVYLDSTICLPE